MGARVGVESRTLATSTLEPTTTALVDTGRTITYAELDREAARVTEALEFAGFRRGDAVGVSHERSIDYVVAVLGTLRAGGHFVPLDPRLPDDRLEAMRRAAGVECVLASGEWPVGGHVVGSLPLSVGVSTVPTVALDPRDLAYGLFTSGSTGDPRCVLVEHRNIVSLLRGLDAIAAPPTPIVGTAICPFGFDVSLWEIFSVLSRGGTLHIVDGDDARDATSFAQLIIDKQVTNAYVPPGMLLDVIEAFEAAGSALALRRLLVGVEPIEQRTLERMHAVSPKIQIVNGYGPTETTVCATAFRFASQTRPAPAERTPIGHPLPGYCVTVITPDVQPVGYGEVGEVLVGGCGVARGYASDPAYTAARFVADPFSTIPGARAYRTGDLAREGETGALVFVGRNDRQVKVRGFRVDLPEVEAVMHRVAGVRRALALAADRRGVKQLVAFAEAVGPTANDIRSQLARMLPPHAVPDRVLVCDRFPETANGKADVSALQLALRRRPDLDRPYSPPATAAERLIASIWEEVLAIDEIGVADEFVALGGNSLLAMEVARRIRETTDHALSAGMVLRARTVRVLAGYLARSPRAQGTTATAIDLQATPAQTGLWTLQQFQPANAAFYLPVAIEVRGPATLAEIDVAWSTVIERHDTFRTHFEMRAGVLNRLVDDRPRPVLQHCRNSGDDEQILSDLVAQVHRDPPRLEDHAWRAFCVESTDGNHTLLLVVHHILFDGWSLRILVDELRWALEHPGSVRPAVASTSAFAALDQPTPADVDYWRRRFATRPAPLEFPLDRRRGPERSSRGGRLRRTIPDDLVGGLEALAHRNGSTRFATVLGLAAILTKRYAGVDDLVICTPVAQRDASVAADAIGYLVNLVAIRIDVRRGRSLDATIQGVQEGLIAAQAHSAYPFEDLSREVAPTATGGTSALSRFVVVDEADAGTPVAAGENVLHVLPLDPPTCKYELALFVGGASGRLEIVWEYSEDLFDRETIVQMSRSFEALLASACSADGQAAADDLNALDEDQRERALAGGRAMSVPSTDPSLYDLFHEQVDAHGNRPAVVGAGETLSYRELARRARGLARSLREAGVAPGDAVLVCLPPSPDQIVAILAIIESGGYYVPIDGRLPPARVAAVRAATSARIAVTDRPTGVAGIAIPISPDAAIEASATAPLDARRLASSVCYAMFTSGSTGVPKGVLVPDRAVIRLVRDQTFMRVTPEDVLVQISNFSFDAATLEIWGALLNGARVVIPGDNVVSDPLVLADMLELHSPTIGFFNVSLFRRVLDSRPAALRSYHTLLIGGEVVPESLVAAAARLLAPTALLNGYGPTENTTFSCVHRLIRAPEPRELFPIGRPIAHSTAYVTDAALRPSPPGALGEIVVGGAGLAYGYVNDLAATAERFVADPFSDAPGARLYRTGDFGRMRADGSILYVGRADDQVKIRGYRVQLQEIEMFVASVPGVRRAVAVTINHVHGVQLVAFAEADPRVTEHDIRAAVTRIAPHYAVPSQIVVLERFPTTPNGKVDRAALLTLRKSGVTTARGPTSDLEQRVAAIWRDLLGLEVIGVDSAFFEVGGDSLLLIVLRDRVEAEFGLLLPVTSLLEFTTIRTLAARLAGEGTRSDLAAHASARARRRAAFMNSRDASG